MSTIYPDLLRSDASTISSVNNERISSLYPNNPDTFSDSNILSDSPSPSLTSSPSASSSSSSNLSALETSWNPQTTPQDIVRYYRETGRPFPCGTAEPYTPNPFRTSPPWQRNKRVKESEKKKTEPLRRNKRSTPSSSTRSSSSAGRSKSQLASFSSPSSAQRRMELKADSRQMSRLTRGKIAQEVQAIDLASALQMSSQPISSKASSQNSKKEKSSKNTKNKKSKKSEQVGPTNRNATSNRKPANEKKTSKYAGVVSSFIVVLRSLFTFVSQAKYN